MERDRGGKDRDFLALTPASPAGPHDPEEGRMKRIGTLAFCLGLLVHSQGAGAAWTAAKRLTWTTGSSSHPAIAVDPSGNPHVVWEDDTSGNSAVYYKKSLDGGATWASSQRLTWTADDSQRPALAVDSLGALHMVWMEILPTGLADIYYKKSTNGGDSWSSGQKLNWTGGSAGSPTIVVDASDNLHVSWYAYVSGIGETDIFYKMSTTGGTTWSSSRRLSWTPGYSWYPALAVADSANLHLVWEDAAPGNPDIYYRKSGDGGASWSTVRRLTWTSGSSIRPAIAVSPSGVVNVVWEDDTPGVFDEIYAKRSTNGGANWTANVRLTWYSGDSMSPAVAGYSSANLHLFWADVFAGPYEIYYKKSTNGGENWSTNQRLTWNSGYSSLPAVAVDSSGALHLVWHDQSPGNGEIYYKKGT